MNDENKRHAGGTRRGRLIAAALVVLTLVVVVAIGVTFTRNLNTRLPLILVGMPRQQIEAILGRPALQLERPEGKGVVLIWVDQLWQVDVVTGPDGRAQSIGCIPADSATRQIEKGVRSLFK